MGASVPQMRAKNVRGKQTAVVTLGDSATGKRKDFYLGPWGSSDATQAYNQVVAQWIAAGRRLVIGKAEDVPLVAELVAEFMERQWRFYKGGEAWCWRHALDLLADLYGSSAAAEFTLSKLRILRDAMVQRGWARVYVNRQTRRVVGLFKWAAQFELVPVEYYERLRIIEPLARGRTVAPETERIEPVDDELVNAVKLHVAPQVWAMIRLQQLTAMRPGEVVLMRGVDIDMSEDLWRYRPHQHKTEWRGHDKIVYIGPRARELVAAWLKPNPQDYLFSPADADAARRVKLHEQRAKEGTPLSCGNKPGSNRTARPTKTPGARYTELSYARAIQDACLKAWPPPAELARKRVARADGKQGGRWETAVEWRARLGDRWAELERWIDDHHWHPNQLRHTAATDLREKYGIEAAQVILGHRTLQATQVYAERNKEAAKRVVGKVG